MVKDLATLLKWVVSWLVWPVGYFGLIYWLIDGNLDHLLLFDSDTAWAMPLGVALMIGLVLWSALPRWRRLENSERIAWTTNLPSRLGSMAQAVLSPLVACISPRVVSGWLDSRDITHLAGLAVLLAMTLWLIGRGLRLAIADGLSVQVSAAGLQVRRELFAWSQIEAIESGFGNLDGGAKVMLPDRVLSLSPHEYGPTGRALVVAVERFSPGTTIREPHFQARLGTA